MCGFWKTCHFYLKQIPPISKSTANKLFINDMHGTKTCRTMLFFVETFLHIEGTVSNVWYVC